MGASWVLSFGTFNQIDVEITASSACPARKTPDWVSGVLRCVRARQADRWVSRARTARSGSGSVVLGCLLSRTAFRSWRSSTQLPALPEWVDFRQFIGFSGGDVSE
ncbi:hypothetical protein BJP25_30185 [Actinokineospora bangkokensis]|uniref:Uncharacterized protein n=1 Tax=Actinokineospora bangkokensis TaxID=1193682 RepID=A0A1Q9LFL9_9PSEU|nr:hypothetical protein BJP25_30185 [Actinokineospora bangkokensis]